MSDKKDKKEKTYKKLSESDIQKKLYGDIKFKKGKDEKSGKRNTLPELEKQAEKTIQNEVAALKEEVSALEEKLDQSEKQKELLRKKINKKIPSAPEAKIPLDSILKAIWKRVVLLWPILVLGGLLLFFITIKPKERNKPELTKIDAPVTVGENEMPEEIVAPSGQKTYTLQVAEYSNKVAADRFVDNLKYQGYNVMVETIYKDAQRKKPYFKINIGIFNSYDEATKFRDEFESKTGITDSFSKEQTE